MQKGDDMRYIQCICIFLENEFNCFSFIVEFVESKFYFETEILRF